MVEQHIQEACLSVDKLPENMNKVGIEWKSVILEISNGAYCNFDDSLAK